MKDSLKPIPLLLGSVHGSGPEVIKVIEDTKSRLSTLRKISFDITDGHLVDTRSSLGFGQRWEKFNNDVDTVKSDIVIPINEKTVILKNSKEEFSKKIKVIKVFLENENKYVELKYAIVKTGNNGEYKLHLFKTFDEKQIVTDSFNIKKGEKKVLNLDFERKGKGGYEKDINNLYLKVEIEWD